MARAAALEEAWAWGFDVDAWRAHLNVLSWPEVLRETAIALGLGPKRPRDRRAPRPKQAGPSVLCLLILSELVVSTLHAPCVYQSRPQSAVRHHHGR